MKFKSIIAALAICLAAISCNKEEEVKPICLDGVYAGTMTMNVAGTPMEPIDISLSIQNHKDNKATIVCPSFKLNAMGMPMQMPEMKIGNINVTEVEKVCTLKADPFKLNVEMAGAPMVFENKKGLTGNVKEGKLQISFDITPGAMPMSIDCSFEGSLK